MSEVIEITDEEFDQQVLASDLPTEVDFWAPWCQPCLRVSPIYDKLAREYRGRFRFCKINVDVNPFTAMTYQVQSIPMQMFFVDGQKVKEIVGAVPEAVIRATIDETLRRFPSDPKARFTVILKRLTEQNKTQVEKLRKWAENNPNAGGEPIYHQALQAARELEIASEHLSQALIQLEEAR
jgi:thioredoxin 1